MTPTTVDSGGALCPNKPHRSPSVTGTPVPDAGWIDAAAVAALCRCSRSQALRLLGAWERAALAGQPAPRTQRWRSGRRGRPPLLAWADDVRAHLGIDAADAA